MQRSIVVLFVAVFWFSVAQQYYNPQQTNGFVSQQQAPTPSNNQPMRFSQYSNNQYGQSSYGQTYNQPSYSNNGYAANSNTGYTTNGYASNSNNGYNTQYGQYGSTTPSYLNNRMFDQQFNGISTVSSVVALTATLVAFAL